MPHNRDDMYYHPPGTTRYDVQYKSGALENGVTENEICGRQPADIRWLWVIEQNRYAMPEEIRNLCKRVYQDF